MRIGGFERAAVIDRLRTIPLTPRLKKTLSQAKKSKIYSGEKLENMYSSTSGYDPQPFVCDVQGWASPLRRPVVAWPVDSDRFRRAAWENHFALNPSYDSTFGRSDGWTCDVSAALSG